MLLFVIPVLAGLYALVVRHRAASWRANNRSPRPGESKPGVSVLIPSYMSEKTILRTLLSLEKQDYPIKETIVVNDGPLGSIREMCRKHNARLMHNKHRTGKARALNRAAEQVKSDVILFLDSDTVLRENTLSRLIPWFSKPGVAAVCPRVFNLNRKGTASMVSVENTFNHVFQESSMKKGTLMSFRGCCVAIRSSTFRKLSGWPENLMDDIGFSCKLLRNGYKIQYVPGAAALTREPETPHQLKSQKFRWGKGSLHTLLDNRDIYSKQKETQFSYYLPFLLTFFGMLSLITGMLLFPFPTASVLPLEASLFLFLGSLVYNSVILFPEFSPKEAFLVIPYTFLYIPLVVLIYAAGIVSGISERTGRKTHHILKDWPPNQI